MIALLDKPESNAVHTIIHKLSEKYPQAVIYAAKTSLSQFQFEKTDSGKNSKKFVAWFVTFDMFCISMNVFHDLFI